jgi:hypothetical protein
MRFSFTYLSLVTALIVGLFAYPSPFALSEPNAEANAKIDLESYESVVEHQIEHVWTPPGVPYGGCSCTFNIASDGDAKAIKIKDSSGVDEYDESCLKAIGLAAPFSALPQGAGVVSVKALFNIGGGLQNVNVDMTALPVVTAASAIGNQAADSLTKPVATINPVDLSPYINAAKSKIEQAWSPPASSARLDHWGA